MTAAAGTIERVGYYCGRFGPGLLGEPLNSFSNLAFLLGALYAWRVWRAGEARDPRQLLLFALLASIGVGSFVFHSHPTPATLLGDLVPIQVFGLAALGYACLRYLRLPLAPVIGLCVAFFFLRQGWLAIAPRGALGGGISHVPTLAALLLVALALRRACAGLARYALFAAGAYLAALVVRSFDLPLCHSFPYGMHWLWHLLTALTGSLLVTGMAKHPPDADDGHRNGRG